MIFDEYLLVVHKTKVKETMWRPHGFYRTLSLAHQ